MKRQALAATAAALSLTLAACGSSTADTSTSAAPATTSAATGGPTGSAAPTTAKAGSSAAAHLAAAKAAKIQEVGVPTLGHKAGNVSHGKGFGEVRPAEVFNGGDPTGLVTKVVWHSWGSPRAIGTGISTYLGPGQFVAQGTQQRATIVAFNLGTCKGKLMYRAVEWYFPQHGEHFNPKTYENICTGSNVGRS